MNTCKGLGTILAQVQGRKGNLSFYMGWVELARLKFASDLLKKVLICEYLSNILVMQYK
jgi:hypothetical protein